MKNNENNENNENDLIRLARKFGKLKILYIKNKFLTENCLEIWNFLEIWLCKEKMNLFLFLFYPKSAIKCFIPIFYLRSLFFWLFGPFLAPFWPLAWVLKKFMLKRILDGFDKFDFDCGPTLFICFYFLMKILSIFLSVILSFFDVLCEFFFHSIHLVHIWVFFDEKPEAF